MHEIRRPTNPFPLALLTLIATSLGGCWDDGSSGAATGASSAMLTLQGNPPTRVAAGSKYVFQPTVSRSIDVVTFTITRKPAWANFDSSTGALSGTPTDRNLGATENITIIASNGNNSASIGPFAINVDAPNGNGSGSATLSWAAPSENTNGTAVTDLAGYHIHYGTSESELTQEINVPGAAATSYVVSGLDSGTYYFAVSAYTEMGSESSDSAMGSKTI